MAFFKEELYDDDTHWTEDEYAIGLKSYEEDMATDPYDDLLFEELTDELPVTDPYLKRLQEYIENEGCWGE